MGRAAEVVAPSSSIRTDGGCPVVQVNDLSRSLAAFDPISTLVVVVEMSKASWLVSSVVPGVERQPLKKLEPDATALLRLIERWRNEAVRVGRPISRIALAYEAGRDGFWLARWLIALALDTRSLFAGPSASVAHRHYHHHAADATHDAQPGMDPSQQKMMTFMMPLMLGVITRWNLAAGLCLYWSEGDIDCDRPTGGDEPYQPGPRDARDCAEADRGRKINSV